MASIQLAERDGQLAEADKYRDQLRQLNSLIESLGGNKVFGMASNQEKASVRLSARNQLPGTIVEILLGAVNATVKIDIGNGNIITSSVTNEAVEELGLLVGEPVVAFIKASDVIIGK